MNLLRKAQTLNKITGLNYMNINSIKTTITIEDVAKAISESMESSDALGAFNNVEITSIDTDSGEVQLTLSKKAKGRAKKVSKKEVPLPDTESDNTVIDTDTDAAEDDTFGTN